MTRQQLNRLSGIAPVVLSVMAFLLVMTALATGFEKGEKDEGATAHLFQLLVVAQAPFILAFLATAEWGRMARVARYLALQIAALVMAFAPVAYFRL
ncbi:MAG TPA: hypothetical protein VGI30_07755 [Caulobacteraceae bacterium]|jgi:hypothetical protein